MYILVVRWCWLDYIDGTKATAGGASSLLLLLLAYAYISVLYYCIYIYVYVQLATVCTYTCV